MRPIGVDLFAGAGGLSLGFEQAGFDVKVAVDIDPVHCAVHKFNFLDCAVIARSVASVSAADIMQAGGFCGPVDCVFGGAPCQGFSLIGYRALDDPRNALVLEFVRLVSELDARTFVFENVKGLTVGTHRHFLAEIVQAFEAAGYNVRLPWKVLDAASFGVPQRRERLILIGAKRGCRLPDYPAAITSPVDAACDGLSPSPTCADALGDLPDADGYAALRNGDEVRSFRWGVPSAYAEESRCLTSRAWHYGYPRKWNSEILTSSWRTEHTAISRARFAETMGGDTEPISRFFKLDANGLSNTLRAGTDGQRGAFTSPRPIHYKYPRCITVREMARLHGFPDWFRLHVTKWHGARQIGNAVAPPVARAIARRVLEALDCRPTQPRKAISLGDSSLLYVNMAEASEHFDVPPLYMRRDRKSGARKRTQQETEAARLAALEA